MKKKHRLGLSEKARELILWSTGESLSQCVYVHFPEGEYGHDTKENIGACQKAVKNIENKLLSEDRITSYSIFRIVDLEGLNCSTEKQPRACMKGVTSLNAAIRIFAKQKNIDLVEGISGKRKRSRR